MSRAYKVLLFALFLLILGVIFLYFSPISSKEIQMEEESVLTDEDSPDLTPKNNTPVADDKEEEIEKNSEPIVQKETAKTTENEPASDLMKIIQKLVNWGYSKTQSARTIDTVIIHSSYNALGGNEYDLAKLIEEYKEYGVSPHYLIDREGIIYQLVSDKNIAYHAGESKMPDGRTNVNNFSLGIEIMTMEDDSPSAKQYSALKDLISLLKKNYRITNILGHNQIAPGRKTDPWNFDWKKL